MTRAQRWSRPLVTIGLVGMVLGALDPLEGSLLIVPATGLVAIGAGLGHSRERVRLYWALVLVAVGVGLLWGMSAIGGLGGDTGRSMWWALLLLPYPIGWILGLIIGVRARLERGAPPAAPAPA
jgi:hypothetical protein